MNTFLTGIANIALADVANVASITALIVSLITLAKVRSVQQGQRKARKALNDLYGTQELLNLLQQGAQALTGSKGNGGDESEYKNLAQTMISQSGRIEGIMNALEYGDSQNDDSSQASIGSGYFLPLTVKDEISKARRKLQFIVARNLVLGNVDQMNELRRAARRGVVIEVFSLSSTASDNVIECMIDLLPHPAPGDGQKLRESLQRYENDMLEGIRTSWSQEEKKNIRYYTYDSIPITHCVRRDNSIILGYPYMIRDSQDSRYEERPALRTPVTSVLGKQVLKHLELLKPACEEKNLD